MNSSVGNRSFSDQLKDIKNQLPASNEASSVRLVASEIPEESQAGKMDSQIDKRKLTEQNTVRYSENDKGEASVSVPASMDEARAIAANVPKLQKASVRRRYSEMAADISITVLMTVSALALAAFAYKGVTSDND